MQPFDLGNDHSHQTAATETFRLARGRYAVTAGLVSGSIGTATLQFMDAAGAYQDYEESDGTLPFNAEIVVPCSRIVQLEISGGTTPIVAIDFLKIPY